MAAVKSGLLMKRSSKMAVNSGRSIQKPIIRCISCFRNNLAASGSENPMNLFDRKTKMHQRNVAAKMADHDVYDYLKDEVLFIKPKVPDTVWCKRHDRSIRDNIIMVLKNAFINEDVNVCIFTKK